MNSKNTNSIYEMSRKIEEEDKQFEIQAKNIVNAYRKVEQLKVPVQQKEQTKKPKVQSTYAMKIKETLKEINANKAKQMESIARYVNERPHPVPTNLFSKLQKAGTTRVFSVLQSYNNRIVEFAFQQLKAYYLEQQAKECMFINKFKLFKLFRAWKQQALKVKAKRKQEEQQQVSIESKSLELAKQFRIFLLLKKSFQFWQCQTKRQKRRKLYEQQVTINQIKEQKVQQKSNKSKKAEESSHLQSKVRGFLDGLKQKMEQKDRLKTIKQKTQESRHQYSYADNTNEISNENNQLGSNSIHQQQQQNEVEAEIAIQPLPKQQKKAMTNDDLQKKRKQLQVKHRSRKQALEKLRKEKQQKKKEEERQRVEMQRQIQMEQKRIKQQKYKQYLKNKQDQEEWQKRQKQLTTLADDFNQARLKKYYGWLPWRLLKQTSKSRILQLYQTLLLIIFRVNGEAFLKNISDLAQKKIQNQMNNMKKRYFKTLLKKSFKAIKVNHFHEQQQKQIYHIMHSVNTLKIYMSAWKSIRHVMANENYEWQKPRNKRAKEFYYLQLETKAVRSLKINQQQSKREKCIQEQKKKIKDKIKSMLDDNKEIDYNSYL